MRCSFCQHELKDASRFCPYCGCRLQGDEPVRQQPDFDASKGYDAGRTKERGTSTCGDGCADLPETDAVVKHDDAGQRASSRSPWLKFVLPAALIAGAVLVATIMFVAHFAAEADGPVLVLSEVDPKFAAYLEECVDSDADGEISQEEARAVTAIGDADEPLEPGNGLCGLGIIDLSGIEVFENLSILVCANNNIIGLDLSSNGSLTTLVCPGNIIPFLDLSSNEALESVDCRDNGMEDLALPSGDRLHTVLATGNELASFDATQHPALEDAQFDPDVAVTGTPLDLAGEQRRDLMQLSSLFAASADGISAAHEADFTMAPGIAWRDSQLVFESLYDGGTGLFDGETGESIKGEGGNVCGVAIDSRDGVSLTISDEAVLYTLRSYFGSEPDSLAYLDESAGGGSILSSDAGRWVVPMADGSFAAQVWLANAQSWGGNVSFELGMGYSIGLDEYAIRFYHVVTRVDDGSAFGYHLVSMTPSEDGSDSFPELVLWYESVSAPSDFTGRWLDTDMQYVYTLNVDGTCFMTPLEGSNSIQGTWEQGSQEVATLYLNNVNGEEVYTCSIISDGMYASFETEDGYQARLTRIE